MIPPMTGAASTKKSSVAPSDQSLPRPATRSPAPAPVVIGPRLLEGGSVDGEDAFGVVVAGAVEEVADAVGVVGVDAKLDS